MMAVLLEKLFVKKTCVLKYGMAYYPNEYSPYGLFGKWFSQRAQQILHKENPRQRIYSMKRLKECMKCDQW
jgi:hypothetical protein